MAGKPAPLAEVAQLNVQRVSREGSLSLHVADQLEQLIIGRHITVGQRLPTENGLCDSFGVSRTVIREAITHLKSLGLVETRRGVGTTVIRDTLTEAMPANQIRPKTVEDILYVLELRLNLEPAAAELAALRHDDEDRRILKEKHAAFNTAYTGKSQARDEDYEFHYAIATATKNPFFKSLYEQLSQAVIPRAKLRSIEINTSAADKYLAKVEEEHARILEAILARDPQAAREMMHKHLSRSRDMYSKYQKS